jgi:2-phospho-L-lactate guanylyltransferase
MIFALLPVKAPQNAKQRLSNYLSPGQREALARAMFEEVLATLRTVDGLDRVVVVTSDETAKRRARGCGFDVFEEREQLGHSHSADRAVLHAMELGATSVILLPIDVPLVTKADIESLVAEAGSGLVIVPSGDGTGTNALVRTPPSVIKSCFGPGSFRAHVSQAEALNVPVKVLRPEGIVFDIDTPEDITDLIERAPSSRIAEFLRSQWTFASPV